MRVVKGILLYLFLKTEVKPPNVRALLDAIKKIVLQVNTEQTQYMFMSHYETAR
jgi:hypothetical protein